MFDLCVYIVQKIWLCLKNEKWLSEVIQTNAFYKLKINNKFKAIKNLVNVYLSSCYYPGE